MPGNESGLEALPKVMKAKRRTKPVGAQISGTHGRG